MGGQPYQEAPLPRGLDQWGCVPGVVCCRGARLLGAPRVGPGRGAPAHSENLTGQLSGGAWGAEGCWAEPPRPVPACPGSSSPAPRPAPLGGRQVRRTLCPSLQPWPPPRPPLWPPWGGNPTALGKLKRAAAEGEGDWRKLGEGRGGAQVPFHAIGPAPGAQRGRTAAAQAVCVHIQFITFIENRKPHT